MEENKEPAVENKEPTKENTETQHKEIKRKPLRCFICQKIISKEGTRFFILKANHDNRIKKYFLCDKEIDYLGLDPKKINILKWHSRKINIDERASKIRKIAEEQNLTLQELAESKGWIFKVKKENSETEDSNLN
ncbi:MAG: hypothetical protein QXO65_03595 [Candidatus Aenigmatarchaeota archaeon]